MRKKTFVFRSPNEERTKAVLENILSNLEKDGLAITKDSNIARHISRCIGDREERDWLQWAWNKNNKETIFYLKGNVKVEKNGKYKVRFLVGIPERLVMDSRE